MTRRCASTRFVVLGVWACLVALPLPSRPGLEAQQAPAGPLLSADELARREAVFHDYLRFPDLIRGGVVDPRWAPDGDAFWYATGVDEGEVEITRVDPARDVVEPMFDVPRLRRALTDALGHEPTGRGVPFETFTTAADGGVRFETAGRRFALDLDTYVLTPLPTTTDVEGWEAWRTPREVRRSTWVGPEPFYEIASPDRRWLLSDRDHDLWLRSTFDGRERRLTEDGEERFEWDFTGNLWSPDSRRIATQKVDYRGLTFSPLVHWLGPKEQVDWWYYPDPGDPLPRTELSILDIRGNGRVAIDVGDELDATLAYLDWRNDEELLLARIDRRRKWAELLGVDAETGETRVILTERQSTFVEIRGMLPVSDDRFLWLSERDGWNHIYLYDYDGNLIRRVTGGEWPVVSIVRADEEGGWVYFTAHAETDVDPDLGTVRPYDTHLYRAPLSGGPGPGEVERLTEGTGQHAVRFSPSGRYFLDTHSSIRRPPRTEVRSSGGELVRVLEEADVSAIEAWGWEPPEEFVAKADDGTTDLHGVLYTPADFDPSRSYPVIDHLYGGPQATWVPRTFDQGSYGPTAQALAQMGFIVFIVDGRGTPERGKAFQDVVYGQLGRNEIPDHVAVLEQLVADRPYMDRERVGLYGSSWGGYFTLRGMLLRPDVYRVGVAGAPVGDATVYLGHEQYLDLPSENPEGYAYASNTAIADRLEGNLLMPIGTSDQNVKFAFVMQMAEALIRAGKYFDMIVMPGREHAYGYGQRQRPWHERTYFVEAIRRHFTKYLLLPSPLDVTSAEAAAEAIAGGGPFP